MHAFVPGKCKTDKAEVFPGKEGRVVHKKKKERCQWRVLVLEKWGWMCEKSMGMIVTIVMMMMKPILEVCRIARTGVEGLKERTGCNVDSAATKAFRAMGYIEESYY